MNPGGKKLNHGSKIGRDWDGLLHLRLKILYQRARTATFHRRGTRAARAKNAADSPSSGYSTSLCRRRPLFAVKPFRACTRAAKSAPAIKGRRSPIAFDQTTVTCNGSEFSSRSASRIPPTVQFRAVALAAQPDISPPARPSHDAQLYRCKQTTTPQTAHTATFSSTCGRDAAGPFPPPAAVVNPACPCAKWFAINSAAAAARFSHFAIRSGHMQRQDSAPSPVYHPDRARLGHSHHAEIHPLPKRDWR